MKFTFQDGEWRPGERPKNVGGFLKAAAPFVVIAIGVGIMVWWVHGGYLILEGFVRHIWPTAFH